MKKVSEIIALIEENKKDIEVMPTTMKLLDEFLDGGFYRKELIMLGGQTGIGKSYLAGQWQYNIARQGFKTAYFSLEISNEMVVARLIGGVANIKPARITSGWLDKWEHQERVTAQGEVVAHEDSMFFEDNIYDLAQLKKQITEGKFDFVVIDFIQNIEILKVPDEYTRLTQATRELQKLAKELDICILALSQLSNNVAREKAEKTPSTEYRGSGAIAHAADLGFFIERGTQTQTIGELKLFLKKNRRGPSGMSFSLLFQSPGGKIIEENKG